MEKVDLVLVGAEGVVESGGIINKVRASKLRTSFCKLCLSLKNAVYYLDFIQSTSIIVGNWAI